MPQAWTCLLCPPGDNRVCGTDRSPHPHAASAALTLALCAFGLLAENAVAARYHLCCNHFVSGHPQRVHDPHQ